MQDLYVKNYLMLLKEIKDDLHKRKAILCSWIARLSIVKMSILLNLICKFNVIPIQIPRSYSVNTDKLKSKIILKDPEYQPNTEEGQSERTDTTTRL